MQTPTTTTRDRSGAEDTMCSIMPGTPTHSKTTGPRGVAPAFSAARITCAQGSRGTARSLSMASRPSSASAIGFVRYFFDSSKELHGESAAGSITTSAPHLAASARRPGEKSLAITCRTPVAWSIRITASPIGPQPITTAVSLAPTCPRRTACRATAIGSVSAASSAPRSPGTLIVIDAVTST